MNLHSLECPKCGAPFDIPENARATMECPYCGNKVAVPPELRTPSAPPPPPPPHFVISTGASIPAGSLPNFDNVAKQIPRAAAAISIGGIVFTLIIVAVTVCLPIGLVMAALNNASMLDPFTEIFNGVNPLSSDAPTLSFGSEGTGQGLFMDARAIAIDGQGFVYVAEYMEGRIQRFDAEGNFQNLWMIAPPENSNDVIIPAIAATNDGRVYVIANGDLILFDGASGQELQRFTLYQLNDDSRVYLDDLYLTSDEKLVIVHGGEDILIVDKNGAPLFEIPNAMSKVTKDSELSGSVAVDGGSNIFLLGAFNNAVARYTPDGTFTTRFGGDGDQPGQFRAVQDIAIDPYGQVYVSDIRGISVFDGEGRFIKRITTPGVAYGLAFDRSGGLWATSSHKKVVRITIQAPAP